MNDNEYEMNLWAITAMTVPINDDKKYLEYMYKEYSINYPPTLSFEINIKTQDKVDWKKEMTDDLFSETVKTDCNSGTMLLLDYFKLIADWLTIANGPPKINKNVKEKVDWKKEGF